MNRSKIDPIAMTREELHEHVRDQGRCCSRGRRVPCVCDVSVECSVHGSICVGEHTSDGDARRAA